MSKFFTILIKIIKYVTILPAVIDAINGVKDEVEKVKQKIDDVKKSTKSRLDSFAVDLTSANTVTILQLRAALRRGERYRNKRIKHWERKISGAFNDVVNEEIH